METDTRQMLLDNVMAVVEEIESDDFDYAKFVEDALSIETVHFDRAGNYKGCEILIVFGGPGIWVETGECKVYGAWGRDNFERSYEYNEDFDDYLEEWFSEMIDKNYRKYASR